VTQFENIIYVLRSYSSHWDTQRNSRMLRTYEESGPSCIRSSILFL